VPFRPRSPLWRKNWVRWRRPQEKKSAENRKGPGVQPRPASELGKAGLPLGLWRSRRIVHQARRAFAVRKPRPATSPRVCPLGAPKAFPAAPVGALHSNAGTAIRVTVRPADLSPGPFKSPFVPVSTNRGPWAKTAPVGRGTSRAGLSPIAAQFRIGTRPPFVRNVEKLPQIFCGLRRPERFCRGERARTAWSRPTPGFFHATNRYHNRNRNRPVVFRLFSISAFFSFTTGQHPGTKSSGEGRPTYGPLSPGRSAALAVRARFRRRRRGCRGAHARCRRPEAGEGPAGAFNVRRQPTCVEVRLSFRPASRAPPLPPPPANHPRLPADGIKPGIPRRASAPAPLGRPRPFPN